jgi:hypothetical protein
LISVSKRECLEEVQNLIDAGVDSQWLISLGLEYKYLTEYLLGSGSLGSLSKKMLNSMPSFKNALLSLSLNLTNSPNAKIPGLEGGVTRSI